MIRQMTLILTLLLGLAVAAGPQDKTYQQGRRALKDADYQRAIELFAQVVERDVDGQVDGALYWQAYAYQKSAEVDRAIETIKQLKRDYPESRWVRSANALLVEMGQEPEEMDENAELKLMALNSMMYNRSGEAIPIIRKFLDGDHPYKLKKKALFVLGQHGSGEAFDLLAEIARGDSSPQLQKQAIHNLGLYGGDRALELLGQIYQGSDNTLKKRIMSAMMHAGDQDGLLEIAKSEGDEALAKHAIQQIGLAGGDGLGELYDDFSDIPRKKSVLHAIFLSGDVDVITDIIDTEQDEDLRSTAINKLGLMGGKEKLGMLYQNASQVSAKKEILQALFLAGAKAELREVIANEQDQDLRLTGIEKLGLTGDCEGLSQVFENYTDEKTRERAMHAMFLSGGCGLLADVAKNESSPYRMKAIHYLGLSGKKNGPVLREVYDSATDPELKEKILNAFFLMNDDDHLIEIYQASDDKQIKKKALNYLSMMGSKKATQIFQDILEEQ